MVLGSMETIRAKFAASGSKVLKSRERTRLTSISLGVEEVDFLEEGGKTRNQPDKSFTRGRNGVGFLEERRIPRRNQCHTGVASKLHSSGDIMMLVLMCTAASRENTYVVVS